MPILANIEDEHGGSYRIQFINRENPEEMRWISTEEPAMKEFKAFLDEHHKVLHKGFIFEKGTFIPGHNIESAETIDALNAGFVVQALIEWFSRTSHPGDAAGEINSDLAMALKIHSYVNMTQMGHASLGDMAKVLELVKTALVSEEVAQASLTTFRRALSRLGSVSEGFGIVLGGLCVGLDVYELAHAQNNIEKAVFGTQLAFDSASVAIGLGSIGMGLVGASTAAAVLGGASVILGGLAVGFSALALQYGQIAENAAAVGSYFADVDDAYERGGYRYDAKNQCLIPLPGAVVRTLDLATGGVDFDSQYIYRTRHGSTGSGRINYFFWAGDFPKMVRDHSQAINVRAGIGKNEHASLVQHDSFTTLILPGTPKSFISYQYSDLPGATTRRDRGFDVIRRLEEDEKFDYDFYIFPFEQTIRHISLEYVETPVTIVLDTRSIRLEIPTLPREMQSKMSYTLQGAGGEYTIGLNTGAGLTLETIGVSKEKTMWILDARQLANDSVEVSDDHVVIAGMTVQLEGRFFRRMLIITQNGETLEVDFTNHTATTIAEDANQWPGSSESLVEHLRALAKKHLLHGKFIVINNYTNPITSRMVGRAFYDVDHDRMLYTDDASDSLTPNAELGAVIGNDVYFYNDEYGCLWRVEAGTGKCLAKYNAFYKTTKSKIARIWENENVVMAAYCHVLGRDKEGKDEEGELVYVIESEKMTLASIVGHNEFLQRLSRIDRIGGLQQLLSAYDSDAMIPRTTGHLQGIQVNANTDAHTVNVFGVDDDKVKHRYWLRKSDGAVIKPDLPEGTSIQDDLILAGSLISDEDGSEVFYFFTRSEKTLYRQASIGTGAIAAVVSEQFSDILNFINIGGVLFATTTHGYILQLTAAGSLFLEGVNEHWLSLHLMSSWWQDLGDIAEENGVTTLTVHGIKDRKGVLVPMWYHNSKIVVTSRVLYGKQLQLLGLNGDGSEAWLCHWEDSGIGHLYSQRLLRTDKLEDVLAGNNGKIFVTGWVRVENAQPMLRNRSFAKITAAGDGLQFTMSDGVVLTLDEKGSPALVAVDISWQEANSDDLDAAMETLAKTWPHSGVVVLLGPEESAPSWYQLTERQTLTAQGVTWADRPVWLGTTVDGTMGFIHLHTNGDLYRVATSETQKIGSFALVRRYAKSLVLAHSIGSEISIPTLANIENVMVTGGKGRDTYHISQENWNHYQSFTIENRNNITDHALDRLLARITNLEDLVAQNVNGDLVLLDVTTGKSLTIRKAFGQDPAYRGLWINTARTPLTIEDFEKTQLFMRDILKIDTIPNVTIGYTRVSTQSDARRRF
ncbi:hypothetical protein RUND412_008547 [Rhizina undulata]